MGKELSFDDILLLPQYSEVLPSEARLRSRITADVNVDIPIIQLPWTL